VVCPRRNVEHGSPPVRVYPVTPATADHELPLTSVHAYCSKNKQRLLSSNTACMTDVRQRTVLCATDCSGARIHDRRQERLSCIHHKLCSSLAYTSSPNRRASPYQNFLRLLLSYASHSWPLIVTQCGNHELGCAFLAKPRRLTRHSS
jgi:hypothetical protein